MVEIVDVYELVSGLLALKQFLDRLEKAILPYHFKLNLVHKRLELVTGLLNRKLNTVFVVLDVVVVHHLQQRAS